MGGPYRYKGLHEAIGTLTAGSKIGAKLFGGLRVHIAEEALADIIRQRFIELGGGAITPNFVSETKAAALRLVERNEFEDMVL